MKPWFGSVLKGRKAFRILRGEQEPSVKCPHQFAGQSRKSSEVLAVAEKLFSLSFFWSQKCFGWEES